MRIGIDFDNTIICYDDVFCELAKAWAFVPGDYQGSKQALRDKVREMPEGDKLWQRLQGKVYGELIGQAKMFAGFKAFITACNANPDIELFIVSHKTEFGHFDAKKINLRHAALAWLRNQGLFDGVSPHIPEKNVFFETTREKKIARIKALQCTHFIDDLVEVLHSHLFPEIHRFLFQPDNSGQKTYKYYTHWQEIQHELFDERSSISKIT